MEKVNVVLNKMKQVTHKLFNFDLAIYFALKWNFDDPILTVLN